MESAIAMLAPVIKYYFDRSFKVDEIRKNIIMEGPKSIAYDQSVGTYSN